MVFECRFLPESRHFDGGCRPTDLQPESSDRGARHHRVQCGRPRWGWRESANDLVSFCLGRCGDRGWTGDRGARDRCAGAGGGSVANLLSRPHVERLAAPELDGRLTGTPGADAAAAYLIEQLRLLGAKPLPGLADYKTPFHFTSGVTDEGTTLTLTPTGQRAASLAGTPGRRRSLVLGCVDGGWSAGVRRLRPARPGRAGLHLRQLRRPRRQGQGRRCPPLLPRGRRSRAASSRWPVTPVCATRPWPHASAARRVFSSSPARDRPMPASWFRSRSIPPPRARASPPPACPAKSRRRSSTDRVRHSPTRRKRSTRGIHTSPDSS